MNIFSRRAFLVAAGCFICAYAIAVLYYVQSIPVLGLRSAFSTEIKGTPEAVEGIAPQEGDRVVEIGDLSITIWPDLLAAPFLLKTRIERESAPFAWHKKIEREGKSLHLVRVRFISEGQTDISECWVMLNTLPLEEVLPSILWFFLKVILFVVGALVLWKRPTDDAAAQFFLLCIVTLGAYMGGYHWSHICTQPVLLLVFMVSAVMLPVVSLHFYLIFPRKKELFRKHPRWTLLAIYGGPLAFLVTLVLLYFQARGFLLDFRTRGDLAAQQAVATTLEQIRTITYAYFLVAFVLYLLCVVSLVHSWRTATNSLERNQVKWIFYGAVCALVPIVYSFYLAVWLPDKFAAGAATWPMFGASVLLTAAFAISITRYRLMELDKIISSSVGYFLISFLAGLAYYAVVFVGTLVFNQVLAGPKLTDALTVSTTALVLMLVLDLARTRFKQALDRRFYRDKTQLDRTLQRMGKAIEQLVDSPALAQRLLQASTELLGVSRGAVFLRQGEPAIYSLAGQVGVPPPLTDLPPGCPLIEALQEGAVVDFGSRSTLSMSPAQRQLQFLGGEIAHPLAHEGCLLALLVLGPKDLGHYRHEDLELLGAFAQITVLALESAEGHRTIEVLNRDLQAKVEKISEQQRRILALQTQLHRQTSIEPGKTEEKSPGAEAPPDTTLPGGIVGSSAVVRQLLGLARKVSGTDAVVLIRGESGTGKELLARAVHETSPRAGKAFVKVHCAALSANLLESELFGHVKGAFTGAHRDKVGRFELANGGTLFLDEIGDISLEVQTKLLRVLQEKTFERVGSSEAVTVDVRIITATHQDLDKLIQLGRFREDLFYRLNVFPIVVPPLRDRPEDIAELAMHFVRQSAQRCRKEVVQIDDDVLALLKGYSWPGNIRQLENVIERAVVIAEGPVITHHEIPPEIVDALEAGDPTPLEPLMNGAALQRRFPIARGERDRLEREQLVRVLAAADGNKAEAARALGIARSTLVSRLKKLGLG
jgi:transcriptional regulator with GAF, ATPase, and Fis domain